MPPRANQWMWGDDVRRPLLEAFIFATIYTVFGILPAVAIGAAIGWYVMPLL